jgi:hypothetical protein
MAKLDITHHERVGGHPFRWHVHLRGRPHPVVVDLPEQERSALDMTDEELHDLLPTALQRRADESPDAPLADEPGRDVAWDTPVRVLQMHFMA